MQVSASAVKMVSGSSSSVHITSSALLIHIFQVVKQHRVSWMHPRSKHWHQLDLIITRRKHLHTVRSTRAFHSADSDADHSLVITKVTLRAKKLYHVRNHTKVRINAAATSIPEKAAKFQDLLNSKLRDCSDLEAKECWNQVRDTTLAAAIQGFGTIKS